MACPQLRCLGPRQIELLVQGRSLFGCAADTVLHSREDGQMGKSLFFQICASAAIFLAIQMFSSVAEGQYFETGNTLYSRCENGSSISYIMGVTDGLALIGNIHGSNIKFVCLPSAATAGQINDIVCKYLRENPENRAQIAPVIIWNALAPSFKCAN